MSEQPNPTDKLRRYHQGQLIFKEGQVADLAYLVKSGSVTLFKLVGEVKVILDRLGPGRIFGEMDILAGAPRARSARAEDYTELLAIEPAEIGWAERRSPKLMRNLLAGLVEQLQAANRLIEAQPYPDLLVSVCHLLELLVKSQAPAAAGLPVPKGGGPVEVSHSDLALTAKKLLNVSQIQIDEQLKRLHGLGVVDLNFTRRTGNLWSCRIVVPDPGRLAKVATRLMAQAKDGDQGARQEREFMDLYDFAGLVKSTPEILAKKIGAGEIPLNLLFLPQGRALALAREQGLAAFQGTKNPRSRLESLASANDLGEVDDATLQEVFSSLGHRKLTILLSLVEGPAREAILRNLSRNMARIIGEEAARLSVDQDEALDVEYEAITLIKRLKGLIA